MNLLTLITDDITELLIKIIEFTQIRQKILIQNIKNFHSPGFIPKDLGVDEFCSLLNDAINEHLENQRLILRDTENIKFHLSSGLEAKPVVDKSAKQLLEENRDAYIASQIKKIFENSLNQRVAAELLKQELTTLDYRTTGYRDQENRYKSLRNNLWQSEGQ